MYVYTYGFFGVDEMFVKGVDCMYENMIGMFLMGDAYL
jgi:hypothetical protein